MNEQTSHQAPQVSVLTDEARRRAAVENYLYRLVTADSKRAYAIAFGVLSTLVLMTSSLLLLAGAAPQNQHPWDACAILDGGWRLINGMRPHSDYFDQIGLTSHLPVLVGMWIAGCSSKALAYGPAALLPLMSFWTWRIVQRRFPAFPALWIAILTGGLIVGTFPLGYFAGWRMPSYQMQYNRFQWSLLCLLAILLLVEPRRAPSRRATVLEGAGAGVLAGLLLLGKSNYAVAALVVLGGGILLQGVARDRITYWLAVAGACFAVIIAFFVYLRGDAASCWRDLAMICGVQRWGGRLRDIVFVLLQSWWELWAFCFVVIVQACRIFAEDRPIASVRAYFKGMTAAILLLGLGLAVTAANAQLYDIPLWALATVMLAESLRRPYRRGGPPPEGPSEESARRRVLLSYIAAGIAVLGFGVADFGSVAYALVWKQAKAAQMPADAQINTPPLCGMFCPPTPQEIEAIRKGSALRFAWKLTPLEYALTVNDGIRLLQGRISEKSRVFTMDCCNPFPYALHLAVPHGTPLYWHEHRLLDDSHHPPVQVIFQEVTHVMVPKRPTITVHAEFLDRVCGGYLKEHFAPAAESELWILYVRKPAGTIPETKRGD